jgi:hypothetical protein
VRSISVGNLHYRYLINTHTLPTGNGQNIGPESGPTAGIDYYMCPHILL